MNNELRDIMKTHSEQLKNSIPNDFATNEEIDKLLYQLITIVNNQYDIISKQADTIKAVQLSSDQATKYSRISITVAIIALAAAIILGILQ